MATATLTAPSLAAHVAALLAPWPALTVTAAPQGAAFVYVTGSALDAAAALLGADPGLLLTRCYSGGELALVVLVAPMDTHPAMARPVAPVGTLPTDPTALALFSDILFTSHPSYPACGERRAANRAAWRGLGALQGGTAECPAAPALTPTDHAANQALLQGRV